MMNVTLVFGGEDNKILIRVDTFPLKHYRMNDICKIKWNFKEISKWLWVVEVKEKK
jgi:hypothetical protein